MFNSTNVKNSMFLDELLKIAKSIETSPSGNITAESFVLAVIKVVDGSFVPLCGESKAGLEQLLKQSGVDLPRSKMAIEEHLKKGETHVGDEAYFRIITNFAGKKAISDNNGNHGIS